MARPIKQGIDYFSFDVDFFEDIKIRKIYKACGIKSYPILISLLCNIYKDKGYYVDVDVDVDLPFIVADIVGTNEGAVEEVITKAVQVDFFNKQQYETNKILTSNAIQKRFQMSTNRRQDVKMNADFVVNVDNNSINVDNNSINVDRSTQSKVKESKYTPSIPLSGGTKTETSDFDFPKLISWWNENCTNLPPLRDFTKKQKKAIVKLHESRTTKETAAVFLKANSNAYLAGKVVGKVGERIAPVTIDKLINEEFFRKVESGAYDQNERIDDGRIRKHNAAKAEAAKCNRDLIDNIKFSVYTQWSQQGKDMSNNDVWKAYEAEVLRQAKEINPAIKSIYD